MDITYRRRGFFGIKFKITVYYGGRSESTRNLKQRAPSTRTENECVLFLSFFFSTNIVLDHSHGMLSSIMDGSSHIN